MLLIGGDLQAGGEATVSGALPTPGSWGPGELPSAPPRRALLTVGQRQAVVTLGSEREGVNWACARARPPVGPSTGLFWKPELST